MPQKIFFFLRLGHESELYQFMVLKGRIKGQGKWILMSKFIADKKYAYTNHGQGHLTISILYTSQNIFFKNFLKGHTFSPPFIFFSWGLCVCVCGGGHFVTCHDFNMEISIKDTYICEV